MAQQKHYPEDDPENHELCRQAFVLAIKNALNVVSGKWKLAIVCTLLSGPKRFADIERLLANISPRMLARELRELEVCSVIVRDDEGAQKDRVRQYALTPSGQALEAVIVAMATWGQDHRALTHAAEQHPPAKPPAAPVH